MSVVVEETDETLFWLEFLVILGILDELRTLVLRNEIGQLVRLFSKIRKRMKEKIEVGGGGEMKGGLVWSVDE